MIKQNRHDFIDVAKGLGMILVVFAHLIPQGTRFSVIIYGFHMPLFFFLSGIFAGRKEIPFIKYVGKQAKRLLIPFVVVFLLGVLITALVPIWELPSIENIVKQLIYANPINLQVGPIWFLAALFDVSILFYFYKKLILSKNNPRLTGFSLGLLALAAFYLPMVEGKVGIALPFKLDISLMALLFYTIGYLSGDFLLNPEEIKSTSKAVKWVTWVISLGVTVVISIYINGMTYLSGGMYGKDIFSYVFPAMCGIYVVLVLSKAMEGAKWLSFIGRNSLVIFSVHSILTALFTDLILIRFKDSAILTLLFSLIGTVLILAIMCFVAFICNKVKEKCKNIRP